MEAGTVVAHRFEIERFAAAGAMGAVYRAIDLHTGEPVAIKVMRDEHAEHKARFSREALVLAELSHPGIVRHLMHGFTAKGEAFLVMEWLEGETLTQRMARRRLSIDECLVLAERVADALSAAHRRNIVHRDIKPSNLLLPGGRIADAKLFDFGVARVTTHPQELTVVGASIGTPGYMSPEQVKGVRGVDARADVFALGCVLFKCLTGRGVFGGSSEMSVMLKVLLEEPPRPSDMNGAVPADLDDLVARMLAKEPGDRPADGGEVAELVRGLRARSTEGAVVSEETTEVRSVPAMATTPGDRVLGMVLARDARFSLDPFEDGPEREDRLALRRAIARHEGELDFLPDGSMVVALGTNGGREVLAERAARCALSLRALLPNAPIAVVTGDTGPERAATFEELIDRGVPLLDRSARVIRLDDATAKLLDKRFVLRKDKAGFVLDADRAAFSDLSPARTLLGKDTLLLGRDRELFRLRTIVEHAVAEKKPRAILVAGSAGIGKTRLVLELLRAIDGVTVWVARGEAFAAGSSFGAIAPVVRRLLGVERDEPLAARVQRLAARYEGSLAPAELARVAELASEIAGAPIGDEASPELRAARRDPRLMFDRVRRAFEDLVAAECDIRPLCVVLEDLQWVDAATLQLVEGAMRRAEGSTLLVLGVLRSEDEPAPALFQGRAAIQIPLDPLDDAACSQIVERALGGGVKREVVREAIRIAAGNPFALEEAVRAAHAGADLRAADSVRAILTARFERLDAEARRVLAAASVFGAITWRGGVEAIVGDRELVERALGRLCEEEILALHASSRFPEERQLGFRYGVACEAAYALLSDRERAEAHAIAAGWLQDVGERDARVLAEHFDRGELTERAVVYLARAAAHALEGNDLEGAIASAERALALGAGGAVRGELDLLIAEANRWLGHPAQAAHAASTAMEELEPGSAAWLLAVREASEAAGQLGETARLVALADALEHADARDVPAEIEALVALAGPLARAGAQELAESLFRRLDAASVSIGPAEVLARARVAQGQGARALLEGDLGSHLRLAERAATAFDRAGDARNACRERMNVGWALLELGAYERADATLREAEAAALALGVDSLVGRIRADRGAALHALGSLDEARSILVDAVYAALEGGDRGFAIGSRARLALVLLALGDRDGAEREALAALEGVAGDAPARALVLGVLARARLAAHDAYGALDVAQHAMEIVATLGRLDEGESLVRLAHAEALRAAGHRDAARTAVAIAREAVIARAMKIKDAALRDSFLARVPENARILELAVSSALG